MGKQVIRSFLKVNVISNFDFPYARMYLVQSGY